MFSAEPKQGRKRTETYIETAAGLILPYKDFRVVQLLTDTVGNVDWMLSNENRK